MRGPVKTTAAALLKSLSSPRRLVWFGAAVLILMSLPVPGQQAGQNEPKQEAQPAAAPAAPAEYVGSEMCQACHEDIYKAFRTNRHFAVERDKKRGWEGKSCESCHGPGSIHAESAEAKDIRNPAKLAPKPSELACLKCHNNQKTNVGRVMGGHGRNEVACASCHSVHKAGSEHIVQGRFARINTQCAGCHQASWAQFQKPHRHRLPENAMSCVDCHNPHGSMLPGSIRTVNANDPGCFKCHGDKRGPFTFEHAPVRMDGCGTCHEPHGSQNPKMLTRHEERFVCLECHSNIGMPGSAQSGTAGNIPPAFHNLLSPRFQRCSTCHVKVHGSNVNRAFTR